MSDGMQFDFKANYENFLNHKPTVMVPNSFVGNAIYGFGSINGPKIEKGDQFGDRRDGFGNLWEYPSSGGGAAVPDTRVLLLDDICDWREKVNIPDAAAYDWKADYAMECQILGEPDREHNTVDFGFGNGVFERLAALMGFEEALYSIAAEPEETYALFEAITDYKVEALDYIIDAYHPDTITYYDDVATQRNLFVSPAAYREVIKPHHKRFAQECIKRGVKPIYHCCGYAQDLVEDMIDCGWVAWSSVQRQNDIAGLIEKYGDKIGFVGGYDTNGRPALMSCSDEEIAAEVKRCYDEYGKAGYGFCFFGFRYPNSSNPEEIGAAMVPIVQTAVQYGFEQMASKMSAAAN